MPATSSKRFLRARVVVPVNRPPIENGVVLISGGRIAEVARWRDIKPGARAKVLDLGEVALLPGLINAHCHLDYTDMAGQFPPPEVFTDWLKQITETKAGWNLADFAHSWQTGAEMLVRTGTTTVGDIEAVPDLLPHAWSKTPLRVWSFIELIGITSRRPPETVMKEAGAFLRKARHPRAHTALSPHAPYSTVPELLRQAGLLARRLQRLVCVHVGESALEFQMFTRGSGEMFDWIRRSGRDMGDCGNRTPVEHLEHCGLLGPNLLAVHVNYTGQSDAALLARRGVHVIHCPRSHFYFRHDEFPLRKLLRAGVNVCLGTDSLASVYKRRHQSVELNMFEEMRSLATRAPWLRLEKVLRMATANPARALGMAGKLGELSRGALADLIAIPFSGKLSSVHQTVLEHGGDVPMSMIQGRWAVSPNAPALSARSGRKPSS